MNVEEVANTLLALFEQLENLTIENCALKAVLKEALPNNPDSLPLPQQVLQRFQEMRYGPVYEKFEHLRQKIRAALEEGRLPELSDLVGSVQGLVN